MENVKAYTVGYFKILAMILVIAVSVAYISPLMIASYSTTMMLFGLIWLFVALPAIVYFIIRKF